MMGSTVDSIVRKLWRAHETKEPIEFIHHKYALSERDAYAVQDAWIKRKSDQEKADVAGYKISMTSADTQAIAQTDEPAFGTLLPAHLAKSGDAIPLSSLFDPLIEPEIMFIPTEDLSAGASEKEIIEKCHIAAGIEIPDSRYIDWFPHFTLADLLCDNAATGRVVVSEPIKSPSFEALGNIKMALFFNGEKIRTGNSSAVLENPASAVAWLSQKLAAQNRRLQKSMVIASGTFIPPIAVQKGTYKASYSDIGEVKITFT